MNRDALQIGLYFPELMRIPVLRRLFGAGAGAGVGAEHGHVV
jgi:hypothetical protein